MSRVAEPSVSVLLARWGAGDEGALRDLVPLVYPELRRLAHQYMRRERPGHTLQTTALVHEAYLRLNQQQGVQLENRAHLIAISAQLMRQVLVEYARRHRAAKRGGGYKVRLEDAPWLAHRPEPELLALDDALTNLSRMDPRQGRILELRFFGGLSIEETAQVVGASPATVKRDWVTARIWLQRELKKAL
jgi:RNA polymerase sigma factor (TIGR02999 family)